MSAARAQRPDLHVLVWLLGPSERFGSVEAPRSAPGDQRVVDPGDIDNDGLVTASLGPVAQRYLANLEWAQVAPWTLARAGRDGRGGRGGPRRCRRR